MGLSKAKLKVIDKVTRISKGEFDVQFNPTEYTVNKGVKFAEVAIPGLDTPLLQFVRGESEQLTMDLFFDTTITKDEQSVDTASRDVRDEIANLLELVKIQPELHAPPRVEFIWGSLSFQAVVASIQQRFTLFNSNGVPLRATLSVTFRKCQTLKDQLSGTPRHSADRTKTYVTRRGDTPHSIAAREYRDPAQWRAIAEANDIANPRRIAPGTLLIIPPLDPADRVGG